MSLKIVSAKEGNIHNNRIEEFLFEIDADFVPPLSSRVSIVEYVEKVMARGIFLVALENDKIVGVTGFYCNDNQNLVAYWTLAGVTPRKRRKSIAQTLLEETIKVAKGKGMKKIRGETSSNSPDVLAWFNKNGFVKFELGEISADGSTRVFLERDI